jgi:hypothetical protein
MATAKKIEIKKIGNTQECLADLNFSNKKLRATPATFTAAPVKAPSMKK